MNHLKKYDTHKLERKYIGIELQAYAENDSIVRLQNIISSESSGISKTINWEGGGSFYVGKFES